MIERILTVIQYSQSTLFAVIGVGTVLSYYLVTWFKVGKAISRITTKQLDSSSDYDFLQWQLDSQLLLGFFKSTRYLIPGWILSLLFLALSGSALEAENDWWEKVGAVFLTFMVATALVTLAVGCIFLMRHWRELFSELTEAETIPLLKSIPVSIIGLGLIVGAFVGLGAVVEKIPELVRPLIQPLFFLVVAALLYRLWTSRSYASLLLRALLLLMFSLILAATAVGFLYWLASKTTPLLVILLVAMGLLNFVFFPLLKVRTNAGMDI